MGDKMIKHFVVDSIIAKQQLELNPWEQNQVNLVPLTKNQEYKTIQ